MSGDYFALGGGTELKLCRMKGAVWDYQSVHKDMCVSSVWVSVCEV